MMGPKALDHLRRALAAKGQRFLVKDLILLGAGLYTAGEVLHGSK